MVWIYGGGFTAGSDTDDDPSRLAESTGVLVVSFNHRLGPLGLLGLSALASADPADGTGNFGLKDQQAALRWVQGNITAFGGDPRNEPPLVTGFSVAPRCTTSSQIVCCSSTF
jgi:para-nitrobenzyl esterase